VLSEQAGDDGRRPGSTGRRWRSTEKGPFPVPAYRLFRPLRPAEITSRPEIRERPPVSRSAALALPATAGSLTHSAWSRELNDVAVPHLRRGNMMPPLDAFHEALRICLDSWSRTGTTRRLRSINLGQA